MTRRQASGGFTLVEVLVTLVIMTVIGVSLAAANQYSTRIMQRSRMEINAARFLVSEVERLRLVPYTTVTSGTRAVGRGISTWTVIDSTSFRRVFVETRYGSAATGLVIDSVTIYRVRP